MVIDFITTPIWKALGEETDRATNAETDLKRNTFANAEYVASEKMIYLSNGFGEVIDSIDCTDFVIDGMVENVTLNGNILTIVFNTDAGKQSIDIDLTEFINPQNYYLQELMHLPILMLLWLVQKHIQIVKYYLQELIQKHIQIIL